MRAGRQAGKTFLAAVISLENALKSQTVLWVAPIAAQARYGSDLLKQLTKDIPFAIWSASTSTMTLGDGSIIFRSADNPDRLRGLTTHMVVIDEGRDCPSDTFNVLRPCLARYQGRLLSISTPNGWGWLTDLEKQDETEVFIFPTSANPFINPKEIEKMRRDLPQKLALQELDAEIIDMANSVFPELSHCDGYDEPLKTANYCLGIDIGFSDDYTVVAIGDINSAQIIHYDKFHGSHPELVERIKQVITKWKPVASLLEVNGMGAAIMHDLQSKNVDVLPWVTSNATKQTLVNQWLIDAPKVLKDDDLVSEFQAYVTKRLPSGLYQYEGKPHDDIVMACMICNYAMINESEDDKLRMI